jgi:Thioesterase-like superfamily
MGVMTIFDEATAVRRVGEGQYEVQPDVRFALVAPGGTAPPAVNGGVLLATMLRAVLDTSPHPHPVATSAHFLRVPLLAPAHVEVVWLKHGGTAATARATLVQDARPVLDLTVTTGTLPDAPAAAGEPAAPSAELGAEPRLARAGAGAGGLTATAGEGLSGGPVTAVAEPPVTGDRLAWTGERPKLPPIEECVNLGLWPGTVGPDGTAGYAAQVDLRLDPATVGWRHGNPAGVPEMRGYFQLREHRDPDAYLLALAVDGLPPVVFGLGATGWAPTVELTWYMRAVPVPGPLQVAARCRNVSGGWFDEEAEVWDAAGRLVAQSRQLARVGRGPVKGGS